MTTLLDSARLIHATLPTLGGQYLLDARDDLGRLAAAAMVLARRDLPMAVPGEIALIRGMQADIEPRMTAWEFEMDALIAEQYPEIHLAWTSGTDATIHLLSIEMGNIETAGHVLATIEGIETSVPGDNVRIDGESLVIHDTREQVLLDLDLRDVAAFGFAEIEGLADGWTGFDLLTHDGRHIVLR